VAPRVRRHEEIERLSIEKLWLNLPEEKWRPEGKYAMVTRLLLLLASTSRNERRRSVCLGRARKCRQLALVLNTPALEGGQKAN
jgi:hypothetical protein